MATLENIRKKGKLIAIVIGFALFAFILGDLFNQGSTLFSSSQRDIAYIDGDAVTIEEFQKLYNEWEEVYKIQSGSNTIDQNTTKELQDQVWEEILRKYILTPRFAEAGIDVSDLELAEMVRGQNIQADPTIRQLFTDPQTGIYNAAAAINFFTNIDQSPEYKKFGIYLEKQMRENKKFSKYNSLISKGLNVTNFDAKQLYVERIEMVDIDYISKTYDKIDDKTIKVTDKEISDYYDVHKNEYKQEASRDIAYVTFNVVPSPEDIESSKQEVESYKKEFSEIKLDTVLNIINFVNANSQNKFNYKHLTKTELNDSILYNAPIGTVEGPILVDGFFQLKRSIEKKELPDSVEARHILILPDGKKILDMKAAKIVADSINNLLKNGGDFEKLAIEFSGDEKSASKGGDLGKFVEGGMSKLLDDVFFGTIVGEIKVVEAKYGYHIINVTWRSALKTKIQIAVLDKEVIPQKETISKFFTDARTFSANAGNSVEKFDAELNKLKLTKKIAVDITPETEVIAGVENSGTIINWIFNEDTEEGSVSEAFQTGNDFVVAVITKIREKGIAPLEQIKDVITLKVITEKKGDLISKEMKSAYVASSDFNNVALKINGTTSVVKNMSFSMNRIQDIGFEPVILGNAFNLAKGKVSEPLKGYSGVYMIKVTSITGIADINKVDVSNDKKSAEGRLMFKMSRESYNAMKKTVEIEDLRYKFF